MGSSPLARGTLGGRRISERLFGLIPARAGNTVDYYSVKVPGGAHPRSRGEHEDIRKARRCLEGSSPLARGTLQRRTKDTSQLGLIPARAGNTAE